MPDGFLEKAKHKEPAEFLTEWVERLGLEGGTALDLGCGSGAEAEYLARKGFSVDAIDKSEIAIKFTKERCEGLPVNAVMANFIEFDFQPEHYTLVTAINSLPFVGKEAARTLLKSVQDSLKPGGTAILAVFGPEHAWHDRSDMSFWTPEEFSSLWDGFAVREMKEFKGMRPLTSGQEIYQHRIHLVAQKIS